MNKHYKNGYYVSDSGKVKRIRYNKDKSKKCNVDIYTSKNGYFYFILFNDNRQKIWIHRAVAELYIIKPNGKWIVDHIDGNKNNNTVKNLRWVTIQENCLNNPKSRRLLNFE